MRIQCGCSWIFQAREKAIRSGQVKCPSCNNVIDVSSGGKQGSNNTKLLFAGVAGLSVVLIALLVMVLSGGVPTARV